MEEKSVMFETIESLYKKYKNEIILDKAVLKRWITEEEKQEIMEG